MRLLCAVALVTCTLLSAAVVAAAFETAAPMPLGDRVIHANQFGGFVPNNSSQVVTTSASTWSNESGLPVAELLQSGFKQGIWETLDWSARRRAALSAVAQFRNSQSAQAQIAREIASVRAQAPAQGEKQPAPFAVPGIPGAKGFQVAGASQTGYNVEFADGPFWYYLAEGFPVNPGSKTAGTKHDVILAARALYARVHGRPSG